MAKERFGKFVTDLCAYFERKQPGPATLDQWWTELAHISPDYYPSIERHIHDMEAWPKNFPQKIMDIYKHLKPSSDKYDHRARWRPWEFADRECDDCQGHGYNTKKAQIGLKADETPLVLSARVLCRCTEKYLYEF